MNMTIYMEEDIILNDVIYSISVIHVFDLIIFSQFSEWTDHDKNFPDSADNGKLLFDGDVNIIKKNEKNLSILSI